MTKGPRGSEGGAGVAAGEPGIGLWIAAMMCGAVGMLFLGKQTDEPWDEMARGGG